MYGIETHLEASQLMGQCLVQWFNGLFHKIYNTKYNIKHMKEQMLDENPAKREAWSTESSILIYTTSILYYI